MADGDKTVILNNNQNGKEETQGTKRENGDSGDDLGPEEARQIGEEMVDEVISIAEKADQLKEHDVLEEEIAESNRLREQVAKELEENDGWMKVIGNEEIMKKVIKEGEPNRNPIRGDLCTMRIVGRLVDDESVVFESFDNVEIHVGDHEVVPGLDLTIPLMSKGELATVKLTPRFGYGSKGLPPLVPSGASLLYEVELIDFEQEKDLETLTITERRTIGNRKRQRGNWWFNRDEAALAVNLYRRALTYLDEAEGGIQYPDDSKPKEEITVEMKLMFEDRLTTQNNLAMAQLRLEAYEAALNAVEAVLRCQPNNMKALFRKGKILGEKGETAKALDVLNKAKSLEPNNSSILAEITKLSERRKKEYHSEKQLYKRMFKDSPKGSSGGSKQAKSSNSRWWSVGITAGLIGAAAVALVAVGVYRSNHQS